MIYSYTCRKEKIMKKIISILLAMSLSIFMFGCGDDNAGDGTTGSGGAQEAGEDFDISSVDGLEGKELAKKVFAEFVEDGGYERNLYVKYKTEMTGKEPVISATYYDGNNMRTEGKNYQGKETITIMKDEDNTMYSWDKESKTGSKMVFGDNDIGGDMEGMEGMDDLGIDEDVVEDDFAGLINAKIDTLNGEKVLYMETEEDGDVEKMWMCLDHKIIVKTELYQDGKLIYKMEALEHKNGDYSDMMVPPSDVNFSEFGDGFDEDMMLY